MSWVDASVRLPATGSVVSCRLRHCGSGNIQVHKLMKVDESDCDWRTADDQAELSYDWDVVCWEDITFA